MKSKYFVSILLIICLFILGRKDGVGQILTDRDFFNVINLDYPGLEQIKKSVKEGDYGNAKKQYVNYLKQRTSPKWFFNWRDKEKNKNELWVDLIEAERYVNNEMLSCGTWYSFGKKIDWTSNHSPNNYDEWTWQLNRFYHWTVLGKAYWKNGDETYARAFVSQLNSWIDQCPKPQKKYNDPGSAWRTIETGIRASGNLPNAFYYFLSSPSFDDESILKMLKSFYEHGKHLRIHHSKTFTNWLSIEMNGLYTIGVLFPEFKEAEEWINYAVTKAFEQEVNQYYPDGAQIELTPSYHSVSGSSILSIYNLSKLNSRTLPSDFVKRLESTYEYYQKIVMPDGTLPAVNDSYWVDSHKYFVEAADLFEKRDDFKYFKSKGHEGKRPKYKSEWMPWAGWYIMRSGWDKNDMYVFFDVGPFGAAHQHEDKLSFILYAYGSQLVTECGTYAYDTSLWREYAVSARGHNVVRVDGMDQNRNSRRNEETIKINKTPQTNVWVSNNSYDYGEGEYTEGYGLSLDKTVSHKRSIKFVKNKYWIVTDTYEPSDDNIHTYDTWFHFTTPLYGENKRLNIIYSKASDRANVAIVRLHTGGTSEIVCGQEKPEIQGWLPLSGGENGFHCEPTATPTYHRTGKGVIKETYLFLPYKTGEEMPIINIRKVTERQYKVYLSNGSSYTIKL